jgi:hypothetical protein
MFIAMNGKITQATLSQANSSSSQSPQPLTLSKNSLFRNYRQFRTPMHGPTAHTKGKKSGEDKIRRFSPEEVNQLKGTANISRQEFSPIIFDDIVDESKRLMTLEHSSYDNKSSSHMDTSRFGENFLTGLQAAPSGRSAVTSKLSYLVDPLEHVKTLRSPIRDRLVKIIGQRCSRSPSPQEERQKSKLVRQVSPVHFGNAKKYEHLNLTKSPIRLLGQSTR